MGTLEKAIAVAVKAHATQIDKGGQPYILHPLRVMMRVAGNEEKIAAMLHDVVEDTPCTLEDLREQGFSEEVVAAVDSLTRRNSEAEYDDFIRRAAANPIARRVKEADLLENMDVSRLSELGTGDLDRLAKYHRALSYLRGLAAG